MNRTPLQARAPGALMNAIEASTPVGSVRLYGTQTQRERDVLVVPDSALTPPGTLTIEQAHSLVDSGQAKWIDRPKMRRSAL
jgi:hypothetical protein